MTLAPKRILVIRPSALGDVCRSVPIAVSLKRAWPEAELAWVVQDSFAEVIRHHPSIDRVVEFPRKSLGRALKKLRVWPTLEWAAGVRGFEADIAIDAQGLLRSGLISWVSGARDRFAYADAQELSWAFGNRRVHAVRALHAVDRMLALVAGAGIEPVRDLRLYADPSALAEVKADPRLGGRAPVVLAPTSRWASKRWPAEKWADLARRLLGRGFGPIAVVGGPGEREQCAPVLSLASGDSRVLDLVGETSVGGLMAVIAGARLVVANDSAAAHMAVGFDRPLVALYGPTRTALVGPYGRDGDVIQRVGPGDDLDHKRDANVALMERIGVSEVLSACATRLGRQAVAPRLDG